MAKRNPNCHRTQPEIPKEVIKAMAHHAWKFVVPIGGAQADGVETCGTGFFLEITERPFLVTAAHVAQYNGPSTNPYGFKVLQGAEKDAPLPLVHPSLIMPDKGGAVADLAVVQVPRGYPGASGRSALPMRCVALSSNLIEADPLWLYGYSADASYCGFGTVISAGFGRPTFLLPPGEQGPNQPSYFYVDYSRERWIKDGQTLVDPTPPAMSGSPIWRTNWTETYKTWTPEDAEVCGIATRWDEATASIAVVRIEHFHAFLVEGLERLMRSVPEK